MYGRFLDVMLRREKIHCLKERKLTLDAYVIFMANVKVCFEDCDVMMFIAMCDLLDWEYYYVKLFCDVVPSIIRVKNG